MTHRNLVLTQVYGNIHTAFAEFERAIHDEEARIRELNQLYNKELAERCATQQHQIRQLKFDLQHAHKQLEQRNCAQEEVQRDMERFRVKCNRYCDEIDALKAHVKSLQQQQNQR